MTYDNWEDACKHSKWNRAVGEGYITYKNARVHVEIIKPLYEDPYIVYYHTGIKIRKATTRETDRIRKWKSW